MTLLKAIILGVAQGLTEFLPISSSGHLVVITHFLGLDSLPLDFRVSFDVILHLGTLVAVIFYFRSDLLGIIKSAIEKDRMSSKRDRKLLLWLLIATLPAAILGKLFGDIFESIFSSVLEVGMLLIITGFFLFLGERFSNPRKDMGVIGLKESVGIGFAQALAIAPGISRSGSTITAAMFAGIKREDAARFSFLLSIPIIAGASLTKIGFISQVSLSSAMPVAAGFLFSALSGYLSIGFLLNYLKENRLYPFAYYCWAAGLVAIAMALII